MGGNGGDTVTGVSSEDIASRYKKRAISLQNRSPEEIEKSALRQKESLKKRWEENKDEWSKKIKDGISINRDKEQHALAVSNGWKNRTPEQKQELHIKRKEIQKTLRSIPELKENYLKGSKAVSIPVKIIKDSGEEFISDSLLKWCTQNNESYGVLWNILNGRGPKLNKYKKSKYLGWQVIKL